MNTYKGEGKSIQYTNGTGSSITSGDPVDFGDFYGISINTIANGDIGAMRTCGEHVLAATTASAWAAGDDLYWDSTNSKLIELGGSGYKYIGKASRAKAAAATTARVLLNFGAIISSLLCDKVWEAIAASTKTLDAQDSGKVMNVTQDCTVTLPATVAGTVFYIRNGDEDAGTAITIDPNGSDKIIGADLSQSDGVTYINTKATAERGDFVELVATPVGYIVNSKKGTWATGS
tara:strand:+ start:26 stop:724 length:699 start_codon:yes stop_codon:yes gene_type:complete